MSLHLKNFKDKKDPARYAEPSTIYIKSPVVQTRVKASFNEHFLTAGDSREHIDTYVPNMITTH